MKLGSTMPWLVNVATIYVSPPLFAPLRLKLSRLALWTSTLFEIQIRRWTRRWRAGLCVAYRREHEVRHQIQSLLRRIVNARWLAGSMTGKSLVVAHRARQLRSIRLPSLVDPLPRSQNELAPISPNAVLVRMCRALACFPVVAPQHAPPFRITSLPSCRQ